MSDAGREQARRTSQRLADHGVDAVYASPLLRAQQTAEAIAKPHGLAVKTVEDLIEVDVGDWEGRPWEEIELTDPEAYRLFMRDASVHPYLGGENLSVVQDRVIPALQQLMEDHLGHLIVVVAHNMVNRSYLAHLLNMPLLKYRCVPQDNCGVNLLRYRRAEVKLVTVNGIAHLNHQG